MSPIVGVAICVAGFSLVGAVDNLDAGIDTGLYPRANVPFYCRVDKGLRFVGVVGGVGVVSVVSVVGDLVEVLMRQV